jgi:site-specific recombinase XerC
VRRQGLLARRDTAIIMLFIDTGMRHDEMHGIELDGVDIREGTVLVTGEGNRQRYCPFGHATARALDRYMWEGAKQRGRDLPALWLAEYGTKPLGYFGINQMIARRCADAGLPPINPHRFGLVAAHEFLADGGRESDLMRLMGWKSQSMVRRYGTDTRARKAHRLHGLGDQLSG